MKNTLKTLIAVLLVISCLFAACACAPEETKAPDNTPDATPADVTPTPDEPDNTPEATPDATPTPDIDIPLVVVPVNEAPQYEQPAADENGKVNLTSILYGTQARTPEVESRPAENWDAIIKASRMFDGTPETYLQMIGYTSTYVIVYSYAPVKPVTYTLTTSPDYTAMPKSWKIYGSMTYTMTDEDLIAEVTNADLPTEAGAVSAEFTIDKPGYYQYFRIEITENNGNPDMLQCGDLIFYGIDGDCVGLNVAPDPVDTEKYTVLNGLISPKMTLMDPAREGEIPKLVFDNDVSDTSNHGCMMTLQWAPDTYESISFDFKLKKPYQVDAYSMVIGNPLSAPYCWKLYGTNDKNLDPETFVLLDERNGEDYIVYEGVQTPVYEVANPGAYSWYILSIETTMYGNDENYTWVEMREIVLYKKN